jgi:hypothetical protein
MAARRVRGTGHVCRLGDQRRETIAPHRALAALGPPSPRIAGRGFNRAKAREKEAASIRLVVVGLADMVLSVELKAQLGDEIELRLEIIDVLFLVVHKLFE